MKVTVIGTGYVGLVTGTCLSDFGNHVICVDIDQKKIDLLNQGISPIYEPGLSELIQKNSKYGRLTFTTKLAEAVHHSDIVFVAVGTPSSDSGEADMQYVYGALGTIAEAMRSESKSSDYFKVIVNKSTVPVGTGQEVRNFLINKGLEENHFAVVSNPEFLREGSAINDTLRPDRIVIGSYSEKALDIIQELYRPLYLIETPIVRTNLETSEMIKYASNCFLACKISFINEMSRLCEKVGGDVKVLAKGMGLDNRIGKYFLHAGPGYGGSCFPKDTKALIHIADSLNYDLKLVKAAEAVNDDQKRKVGQIVKSHFGTSVSGKTIALLGLAFKPNTDDMREAPALVAIEDLLGMGVTINAFDPVAMKECREKYVGDKITYCNTLYDAIKGADGVIIMTEWNEFRELDLADVKRLMRDHFFLDARNIYQPAVMQAMGFAYYGIGRQNKVPERIIA